MSSIEAQISRAVEEGALLPESASNLKSFLETASSELVHQSVEELVASQDWRELNDRFFRTLAFGTGGLRGRTIGRTVTRAEWGSVSPGSGCPEFPCVGTNAMNFYNLSRATQGLAAYLQEVFPPERRDGLPAVCICHDTRYFSREFAERAGCILTDLGCDVFLFESFRSTPELSFAIRMLGAQAGINLTASHNPPPYNGYKVYFEDGGQIVEPHASGIIKKVNAIPSETYQPLPTDQQGKLQSIGGEVDSAYLERLRSLVLDPQAMRRGKSLKIVYSALHGTGGVIIPTLLRDFGFSLSEAESQAVPDGGFPTVESPNPEEAAALNLAIEQAGKENADLVLATDPDGDRLGMAVRAADGSMQLLTGNQIGSLLAWYRIQTLFSRGVLNASNRDRAVLIKTFVTTDLQKAIADDFGLPCVQTLTGFKYIGEKLYKYEMAIPEEKREGYFFLSEEKTRELRLEFSRFFVFGGEESYGYSGGDFVRDKDANSAALMVAEVAAYAVGRQMSLLGLLDQIYSRYGFYLELGKSLVMEGADGAQKIRGLVSSYQKSPPTEIDGRKVNEIADFSSGDLRDEEGDLLPRESMLLFSLEGGFRVAVRPSGTEPKIKYYLFGAELPSGDQPLEVEELSNAKTKVRSALSSIWKWLQEDVGSRGFA